VVFCYGLLAWSEVFKRSSVYNESLSDHGTRMQGVNKRYFFLGTQQTKQVMNSLLGFLLGNALYIFLRWDKASLSTGRWGIPCVYPAFIRAPRDARISACCGFLFPFGIGDIALN
jgi:hypothetical protein